MQCVYRPIPMLHYTSSFKLNNEIVLHSCLATASHMNTIQTVHCCGTTTSTLTSGSGFLHSEISLESSSSALSLTSLKGLMSPQTTL